MQEKECGIVLRRFATSEHKVSVLTNTLGKIALVIFSQNALNRIQLGSLVEFCSPQQNNNIFTTTHLSLCVTPLTQDTQDLAWLHHLLELCYYFIPLLQPSEDCFVILKNSISLLPHTNCFIPTEWNLLKKLCLGALLLFLGFFPPRTLEHPIIEIKNILLANNNLPNEDKIEFLHKSVQHFMTISCTDLDEWLLQCIQSHPRVNIFKTVHLIYPSTLSFK